MDLIAVTYDAHMGDDVMVVNRARVSFRKRVSEMRDRDRRLIRYLSMHGHWAPFSHPQISLHVRAPIVVARQCFKHKVGFAESEVSRRYVDDEPAFYAPRVWRGRAVDAKQGSSGPLDATGSVEDVYGAALAQAAVAYRYMLSVGVAPEQARLVLPQAMMTEWFWTGSLAAWARFYRLRVHPEAQRETAEVGIAAARIIQPLFPESWDALTGG